jgi:glycosyltransferase involved in cell wall biosynthesis
MSEVTVAIPVRNGGELLTRTLRALSRQTVAHELLVCDSGSTDGSAQLARSHGARVLAIDPAEFGHGRTRNLLMSNSHSARVALITQDAEPADELWLESLLAGLDLAADVAIAFGPYLPRSGLPTAERLELERWFRLLSPDGAPVVERLAGAPATVAQLAGARGFFTDANACMSRAAWERVPFRDVPYAEDRVLAFDMLRAGYAKAYVPQAGVLHSHRYGPVDQLRRSFDEWRALREVYGLREPRSPAHAVDQLRGALGAARRDLRAAGAGPGEIAASLPGVGWRHVIRLLGALLGSHAERLPPSLRGLLSLEHRRSFVPLELT